MTGWVVRTKSSPPTWLTVANGEFVHTTRLHEAIHFASEEDARLVDSARICQNYSGHNLLIEEA